MPEPSASQGFNLPPPIVAIAGWLVPGAGYWLIGQRTRGTITCIAIVLMFVLGLLIAGVRVIDVPGYDSQSGQRLRMAGGRRIDPRDQRVYPGAGWALTSGGLLSEIANKPWYVGQVLAGPLCLASSAASIELAQQGYDYRRNVQVDYPRPHTPLDNIGTLYTAVAGMLNLLVIIDSAYRAGQQRIAAEAAS